MQSASALGAADVQGFGDDAEVGQLELGREGSFILAGGSRQDLPGFRVRIFARRGEDSWKSVVLDAPRSRAIVALT